MKRFFGLIAKVIILIFGSIIIVTGVIVYFFGLDKTDTYVNLTIVNHSSENISVSMLRENFKNNNKDLVIIEDLKLIKPGRKTSSRVLLNSYSLFSCNELVIEGELFFKRYPCKGLGEIEIGDSSASHETVVTSL